MAYRSDWKYMNPYDIHKAIINEYILKKPGDTKVLKRNTANDQTDLDVLKANHKFLWNEEEEPNTWEKQFAKKYYDKLFKEYCIGDLSQYKINKVALRWRTEQEVIIGKGQFICANKKCSEKGDLKTWEVNFAYFEDGEKKNALIKIRLCTACSKQLNYHSKKREIKRLRSAPKKQKNHNKEQNPQENSKLENEPMESTSGECSKVIEESPWENLQPVETKSREEEMEDYLFDLLL